MGPAAALEVALAWVAATAKAATEWAEVKMERAEVATAAVEMGMATETAAAVATAQAVAARDAGAQANGEAEKVVDQVIARRKTTSSKDADATIRDAAAKAKHAEAKSRNLVNGWSCSMGGCLINH